MFEYNLTIGDYNDDVRLTIQAKVKHGISAENYTIIREAFNTIEGIIKDYESN